MRASALILTAGIFATLSVAQNAQQGGTVEGTVTNSVTGVGISGASVTLLPSRSGYQAISDAVGHFKITGVPLGTYRASVSKDGFTLPPPERGTITPGLMPSVRVVSANEPAHIDLKLAPLNSMFGRVLDPERKPAAGIEVRLNPNVFGEATTDKDGRFSLENIRSGTYTLTASPPSNAKPEVSADGSKTAMVTTHYPSVTDRSLAQPIVFRGEADLTGYEIRMQTAPVYRVRGVVLDENGKPATGAWLTLYPNDEPPREAMSLSAHMDGGAMFAIGIRRPPIGTSEATTSVKEDGSFEFSAVRSGAWRIQVLSDARPSRGTAFAVVGRTDVDNVEIRFAAPFKLTAAVEWKDQNPGSRPVSAQVQRAAVILVNADGNEFGASGFPQPSGVMNFENLLAGRYTALIKPGLVAQIFLGESEVTGQTFPLAPGGPSMRVVLKTWSGTVRGTVEKGDGATVILIPQRADGPAFGQTVTCGPGGSFELNEVSPGDYYIAAFDHIEAFQPLSQAVLSLVPSRGTSVKVEERLTANVTLTMNVAPR